MFNNKKLSSNGMACASCHADLKAYSMTFKNDFPHKVNMANTSYGMPKIHLDEAIQMCMNGPMKADMFKWGSKDLNNLTVFMQEEHKKFQMQNK